MSKHKSKLAVFLTAILLFGTILPTLGNPKSLAAELTEIDYDPFIGESVKVAPNFELIPQSGETFAEGHIKFEISNGYVPTDKLFLPDGEKVTIGGSTLEVKEDQILLDGVAIASVNRDENGEGKPLTIDLSAPLPNGDFEEGNSGDGVTVPSWEINHESKDADGNPINQVWLGNLATHTQGRPYDKVESIGDGKYKVTGPNEEYTYTTNVNYNARANQSISKDLQSVEGFEAPFIKWDTSKKHGFVQSIDTETDPTKGQSLEIGFLNAYLNTGDYNVNDGKIASSFGIEAISSSFKAKKGDQLSFDWKANDGGDDYEVYGFLVNAEDPNKSTEILYGRGSAQDWTTNSGTVPEDGTYKFRFVAGSFNRTDGTTHGATLNIDNVRVVSTKVVDGVVNAIAHLVQYKNTQYSGNRPVKISVINSEGKESNTTNNNVNIKMSTKDEAATSLEEALTIDSPTDGSYIYDPESKTISGKAEPDSTVNVKVKSDTGYLFDNGTTSTDKDGKWSIVLTENLTKGVYTIEATASKGGATSKSISSSFAFVDKTDLENYYNKVNGLNKDDYSSGWDEFYSALQDAKEILEYIAVSSNNSNPKQEDIDEALSNLQNAKEKLKKLPPVATDPANFENGKNEITIDFSRNIKLSDTDTTKGFTVIVDGKENKVTNAVANGDKLTLIVDQPLDSEAKEVTVKYHPNTTSNLFGDEENGAAVEDFVIQAEDTFGHALQINEPNGTTYNKTPTIKGSTNKDTENAIITITCSNGSKIIVDKDNIKVNPDGSWTYNVVEQLSPGEYEVKVTASKSDRDITKYHKFIVADPPVVNPIPPFGQDLQINEPNDVTNDITPSIKGTTDIGTERATISITSSNGSKVIVDKDNIKINSDGSWTYNVNQKLSPGEYEVKVTVSKTGYQDVTKSHKFIVVDKESLINLKNSITNKKLVKGEYTQDSWIKFEDAYNKAKLVIDNPKATQIEVDNATTSLKNAYDELVYIKALEDEVKQGNHLVQSNYTKDSWAAYQLQLTKAKKVLNNPAATKEQVNKAKAELEKARKALTPIVDNTKVDKTQLIKEYANSSKLKEKDYSTSSWAAYQKALKIANEVINDPNATQSQVDSVKAMLEKARKALSVDKKPLEIEKELSEDLAANNYTKKSWKAYQDSLKHAKSILADRNATQYEINAALNSLKESKDALKRLKAESNVPSKNTDKNVLPNTSTNTYNWLLLGMVFILLGAIILLGQKRNIKKKS